MYYVYISLTYFLFTELNIYVLCFRILCDSNVPFHFANQIKFIRTIFDSTLLYVINNYPYAASVHLDRKELNLIHYKFQSFGKTRFDDELHIYSN